MIENYEQMNLERTCTGKRERVAAYCRVSTDHEDQANSFESQQRFFRQYIEHHPDWELYEIFADEGLSGTSTKKRKAFRRMIDCAKSGCFDLILTKEISRFARNTLDSIYYTRELKRFGVGILFMNDGINTLDADAELRLAILSSIAQEESRKTSERVKWGQKRQMEQGVVFGRTMLGYDIRDGKMTINEEGAKIVRLIFHKYVDEGKGTHVIAWELKEEGILPMRAKEWSSTVIRRIIRNEKYCGDLIQKKTYTPDYLSHEKKYNHGQEEFVILKDHHAPIVSRMIFDEANRILDERALKQKGKAKHSNRYPFSGKIKCGCCGSGYVARYKKRKDGTVYKSWRCARAVKYGRSPADANGDGIACSSSGIRGEDLEYIMLLVNRSLNYDRGNLINSTISVIESVIAAEHAPSDAAELEEQMQHVLDKREKLTDLYTGSVISKEEFLETRSRYDKEFAALQSVISDMDRQKETLAGQQLLADIRSAIDELVRGLVFDEVFYRQLLDKMIAIDRQTVDVYLNLLSTRWRYTVLSGR